MPSRNVYSHKSEEINTLQAESSDNFMRFVHKVPTNFHISQYVVEIGMRWLWELQDSGGDSSWNYNLFKTSYCTLFLYEFFLTQVSHRRFLMRQYQYKFICHISCFPHRDFLFGISKTAYVISPVSPTGVFEKVSKIYNYSNDPHIIFIVL